jgi:hypothetical protein
MLRTLRQIVHRYAATAALVLFMVHLLPPEVLHGLFSHTDSEHAAPSPAEGTQLSTTHTHCAFEQLEGDACLTQEIQVTSLITAHLFAHPIVQFPTAISSIPSFLFLRGPPAPMA